MNIDEKHTVAIQLSLFEHAVKIIIAIKVKN